MDSRFARKSAGGNPFSLSSSPASVRAAADSCVGRIVSAPASRSSRVCHDQPATPGSVATVCTHRSELWTSTRNWPAVWQTNRCLDLSKGSPEVTVNSLGAKCGRCSRPEIHLNVASLAAQRIARVRKRSVACRNISSSGAVQTRSRYRTCLYGGESQYSKSTMSLPITDHPSLTPGAGTSAEGAQETERCHRRRGEDNLVWP